MSISTKICGIKDELALGASIDGGALYIGFVFYEPSPRYININKAKELALKVPGDVNIVAVLVDPETEFLESLISQVKIDFLQLHGSESFERVKDIKSQIGINVIKAIKVNSLSDIDKGIKFAECADMILFDAHPINNTKKVLPGGNATTFDWNFLIQRKEELSQINWILSGGLHSDNVIEAITSTSAISVDVSSGVEITPGKKDPLAIREFLDIIRLFGK